ncbi:MAG: hypothetical protein ABIO93_03280 [Dyadobacter sp.]|uniref:hypothetical protein n=1 Tax=Dyadobacter sp. TaxID=1914288 RepID=UPI003262F843
MSAKVIERLTLFELDCKYGNGDWAYNPKYSQVWFNDDLITWEQLRKWFGDQNAERPVDVDYEPETTVLKIKTISTYGR